MVKFHCAIFGIIFVVQVIFDIVQGAAGHFSGSGGGVVSVGELGAYLLVIPPVHYAQMIVISFISTVVIFVIGRVFGR